MNGDDPYSGAYAPLDDAWAQIKGSAWDLRRPPRTRGIPRPARSAAIKLTQQRLQIGAEARSILPEREARQYLLIQNATGSGPIYIGFNEIPSDVNGIEIIAGGSIEIRDPAPSNQVYVVCPSGSATVRVLEG